MVIYSLVRFIKKMVFNILHLVIYTWFWIFHVLMDKHSMSFIATHDVTIYALVIDFIRQVGKRRLHMAGGIKSYHINLLFLINVAIGPS